MGYVASMIDAYGAEGAQVFCQPNGRLQTYADVVYKYLNDNPVKLPNLDRFYEKMVHIPCGWWVTKDDCDKMIELIRKGW